MEKKLLLQIRPAEANDISALSALEKRAFGPGRYARTAYRVREQGWSAAGFGVVASQGERIVGSVWFSPISVGKDSKGLLLGPLLVDPDRLGEGIGSSLMTHGIEAARDAGFEFIVLVGDVVFYERFGFQRLQSGSVSFPGPVDPARILAVSLGKTNLASVTGAIRAE